uniref:Uncharacterized protein n=1 Tax=Arundo donax TaxID=35708 RepID=A0A0A9AD53_ARUDO
MNPKRYRFGKRRRIRTRREPVEAKRKFVRASWRG